jgi:ribokinase
MPLPSVFVLGNFIQVGCWFIPRLPQASDTLFASNIHFEPGGKGLNVAVGLKRLGLSVDTLIGIGDDAPAQELLTLCRSEGIHTKHIYTFNGSSGWGSGWVADTGQYAGAVFMGANLALQTEHADLAQPEIEGAGLVYGQFETALPVVEAVFAIAHAKGIPTVLNPSPWQVPPELLYTVTHTLLVNELEAQYLLALDAAPVAQLGNSDLASWRIFIQNSIALLWARWPSLERLIVTLGELGCIAFERSGTSYSAPAPTIEAVDSVGAGDAFASGYCYAILNGQTLADALRYGNACGAYVASKVGVISALPTLDQLKQELLSESLPIATTY